MPSPAPSASRRTLLTGGTVAGAALLAVAGCGDIRADGDGAAADDPSAPSVNADSELVETVGGQLARALGLAAATAASVPQVRQLARGLVALHRTHLSELGQPDSVEGGRVTGTAEAARARLLRSEEKLQQQLVRAALDAESGALAQVFASMAAAVAQERAAAS